MDRQWGITKNIEDLNTINEQALTDSYKAFCPATAEYTFYSSTHGIDTHTHTHTHIYI